MKKLYFVIGTEAEIMKMYSVIQRAKHAGFECRVISTGQNDISNSTFMRRCGCSIDIDLTKYAPAQKSGKNYTIWMMKTIQYGVRIMKKEKEKDSSCAMIVHGDTMSTLLGSIIAKMAGIHYSHVEGGLRSYNWFNPFPEEIDRYFASKSADIIFCPHEKGEETAKRYFKGEAVNTHYNTNIETLYDALKELNEEQIPKLWNDKYFVTAIHRQENLLNRKFMIQVINAIVNLAKTIHCVFILHEQTRNTLEEMNLKPRIENDPNITIVNRLPYLEFISAVYHSEFLLADGAGNQQEMYYMGKPYLIIRRRIEKDTEGIGENCIGYNGDFSFIEKFGKEYKEFVREPIRPKVSPSEIIVNKLLDQYGK